MGDGGMTCGDLFAGIGGMSLGLERAGFTVRWQVETDPYCENILARHWPHVHRRQDVRFAGTATLERVDLIAGGFPCQDISAAGKGAGLERGHRSGLWREFARIVRELRPSWVLVENVPALRRRGADLVLGDLHAPERECPRHAALLLAAVLLRDREDDRPRAPRAPEGDPVMGLVLGFALGFVAGLGAGLLVFGMLVLLEEARR